MNTITDVLGNTRQIERYYPDGSFDCPFCSYPVHYPGTACNNPWCNANPLMPVNQALENTAKEEAQRAEEARRKHDHETTMQRIKEENEARAQHRAEVWQKAREGGYCVHCAIDAYGRVKYIKHRGDCPKMRR